MAVSEFKLTRAPIGDVLRMMAFKSEDGLYWFYVPEDSPLGKLSNVNIAVSYADVTAEVL